MKRPHAVDIDKRAAEWRAGGAGDSGAGRSSSQTFKPPPTIRTG